ncbi:hypothetical protein CY34DRAFT_25040 [Suillus luteus UH-Slu-Lm8-n1]|uniref:Uncharacterized protein n=1 Tax=Suillus luteus UH-Slu-Lm8-n1 TaxID=930992 RepID=A0A0D0AE01_9AGAM|nr:hypothetical protein CY34DRAFT_25040 [Suillus luteus UH-Slu-Lm8-n1]
MIRQMNMDYALSQVLNYKTDGISHAITFYAINCQYNKYLKDQIASSMYLSIPIGIDIIPRIGLWHVHGHQDSCFVWYASNFIHGTGRIDGEIMETLWAPLNIIFLSARGMGTPYHKEVLDYQMNDYNFMKMIRITKFLSRKLQEAIKGAVESKFVFDDLNETTQPDMVILWKEEEALAHTNRAEDPAAMDIYEVRLERAPTRKQQELCLLQAQNCPNHLVMNSSGGRGAATWLATSLTIEESQISLSRDMAPTYLGVDVDADDPDFLVIVCNSLDDNYEDYSDINKDQNPRPDIHDASIFQPKLIVIPLPSNIGEVRCRELGLINLMKKEIALREGQANDALHAIRVHLGDKAVIFHNTVWSAKSQASCTRTWTQVYSVETRHIQK